MTDRDMRALAILQGLLASGDGDGTLPTETTLKEYWLDRCKFCYMVADQMNKAREES